MWPFRSLQDKIGALEDQLAGLKAELSVYEVVLRANRAYLPYYMDIVVDTTRKRAVLASKLARLRRQHEPWTVETCSIAERQLESVLEERAKLREAKT